MFRVITANPLCIITVAYMIWGWNFDVLQPIRKFLRRTRVATLKKEHRDCCPSCNIQFGKGRRRKLVDVCGHTRCYSCIIASETCPTCITDGSPPAVRNVRTTLGFIDKIFHKSSDNKRRLECKENGSPKRPRLGQQPSICARKRLEDEDKRFSSVTVSTEPQSTISNTSLLSTLADGTLERETCPLTLKPLFFEVPEGQPQNYFVGRRWLFREIENIFLTEKVALIIGQAGTGKTSIILELVEHSCFGRKYGTLSRNVTDAVCDADLSKFSLARRLVAYHFCQKNNKITCLVPEFVHNLAAQLCQAPPLISYRRLLLLEPRYQAFLSLQSCISNPISSFTHGILEPLNLLKRSGKVQGGYYLLVIDAFNEADDTELKNFLMKIVHQFPAWIKVLITSRYPVNEMNCHIFLDEFKSNELLKEDIYRFITERIDSSPDIQANILNRTTIEKDANSRFAEYLMTNSYGSFLYVKLVLNLIEKRHLVLKSESYRILPVTLAEVFQLIMNINFNTSKSFEKIKPILEICMATPHPLTTEEIYHTLNSRYIRSFITWKEFLSRIDILVGANILVKRKDETLMILHPSLSEWMENEDGKFRLNIRDGHSMIAFRLSRLEYPLESEKLLELAYHVSNSNLLEAEVQEFGRLSAYFLLLSAREINSTLGCLRNLSEPYMEVNKLLLNAEGNPDLATNYLDHSPIISYASYYGHEEMVKLLLQFGSDINRRNTKGETALHMAAKNNHLSIVRILSCSNCQVNSIDDEGKNALVHAAENGHTDIVRYLLNINSRNTRRNDEMGVSKLLIEDALVAAASGGHLETCNVLLNFNKAFLNQWSSVSGHTPLSAACTAGHKSVVVSLVENGANVGLLNQQRHSPMSCAINEGHWEIVNYLLLRGGSVRQADGDGLTPLMISAKQGYIGIMELLVSKGALITTRDKNGLTALDWACIKAQVPAARWLLDRGADINGVDEHGRTPLSLAAADSDADTIQLLIDRGAKVNHVDRNGLTPLDRALSSKNGSTAEKLLRQGARIGPQSWEIANDKPDMLLLLFGKVLKEHPSHIKQCNKMAERLPYSSSNEDSTYLSISNEVSSKQLKY